MKKYLETFNFNGNEYYIGSKVKLKSTSWRITTLEKHSVDDNGNHRYEFCDLGTNNRFGISTNNIDKQLLEVVEPIEHSSAHKAEEEYYKDTEVDAMLYGWVLYIVTMLLVSIFKGNFIGWIFISIYFFQWRKNKLRK